MKSRRQFFKLAGAGILATKAGATIEMGRGIIDIPEVIASLRKIKYNGKCSLEFEKDAKDPLPGIAESIGYFKGVMAC